MDKKRIKPITPLPVPLQIAAGAALVLADLVFAWLIFCLASTEPSQIFLVWIFAGAFLIALLYGFMLGANGIMVLLGLDDEYPLRTKS